MELLLLLLLLGAQFRLRLSLTHTTTAREEFRRFRRPVRPIGSLDLTLPRRRHPQEEEARWGEGLVRERENLIPPSSHTHTQTAV